AVSFSRNRTLSALTNAVFSASRPRVFHSTFPVFMSNAKLVGSGTGAVIRRRLLGRVRGFPLRARVEVAVIPFPVPATSHAACGFTALRAPASLCGKGYGAVRPG